MHVRLQTWTEDSLAVDVRMRRARYTRCCCRANHWKIGGMFERKKIQHWRQTGSLIVEDCWTAWSQWRWGDCLANSWIGVKVTIAEQSHYSALSCAKSENVLACRALNWFPARLLKCSWETINSRPHVKCVQWVSPKTRADQSASPAGSALRGRDVRLFSPRSLFIVYW